MGPQRNGISKERIAKRAQELWEARGCPRSDGVDEWMAAERELRRGDRPGVIATFKKIVASRFPRPARKAG